MTGGARKLLDASRCRVDSRLVTIKYRKCFSILFPVPMNKHLRNGAEKENPPVQ